MRIAIRKFGNSQGLILPKPLLEQAGLDDAVDVALEHGALVLRKPAGAVREGWAEASAAIAEREDDTLVLGEFANAADVEVVW